MEEEGERRRRGISAYNKRRRPPTQSSKSSSPSQGTSASLRCCAGGAEELKIFIWSRSCQYGGGRREVKERRGVGKTCSRERWHFNHTTILFTIFVHNFNHTTILFTIFVHNFNQTTICSQYEADPQTVHPLPSSPSPTLLSMSRASHRGHPHRSCSLGENYYCSPGWHYDVLRAFSLGQYTK